jgi:quinol monooxygenase YgiN
VFYSPLRTQIIDFPTYVQTVKWTRDVNEGHPLNEELVFNSKEGQEVLLEAELRALVGPTRKEDGCLQYDLHRGLEHPSTYLLHEVWASREHHTAHTRTSHFLRWNARKDALLVSRDSTAWHHIA